jgi:hypothetical protein
MNITELTIHLTQDSRLGYLKDHGYKKIISTFFSNARRMSLQQRALNDVDGSR